MKNFHKCLSHKKKLWTTGMWIFIFIIISIVIVITIIIRVISILITILVVRQQLVKVKVDHLPTGNVRVTPTDVAENLGTWFDANVSLTTHINKTCNAAFYFLHNLRCVRNVSSALVMGRIDYCNSLLFSLLFRVPDVYLNKLSCKEFKIQQPG